MPIKTRTVAKGIPPRLHEPKQNNKSKKGKGNKKSSTMGSNKKRVAASDSNKESDDSASKGRKGKGNKRHRLKAQEGEYNTEEEVVSEHASEPPELIDDNRDTTPP
jgi:hypothetical protein